MAHLSVLEEELMSVNSEIQAVKLQIQELLERQQELDQKKSVLKMKIKQLSKDDVAGSSTRLESSTEAWNKQDFPWSEKIEDTLQTVFKLSTFRPLQLETINVTMARNDIFLVMPTGGGKSLCFQLPALCSEGFTLVICPLISLMEDQIMVLEQLGVPAVSLNASSSKEHVKSVHNAMVDKASQLKLIYVTPEKIAKSKMFMSRLEKAYNAGRLSRIAVDEVHCCSQWGHDFRPDYKLLGILKRQFPNVPLIGLTGTATSHVLKDVQKILCIQKSITFTASFNRPNLFYEVRQKPSSAEDFIEDIYKLIHNRYSGQSGIIYCFSQKDSEQVTICLQKKGISAGAYHANMDPKDKTRVHKRWSANEIQVVVATVAFGMGIDKPNVRFVIHHSMSKSMENYYQESGRAGRDDQKADCILYFGFSDIFRISTMVVMENVGQKKLYEMVSYCLNLSRCRRVLIAHHFDEVWDSTNCNKMCDNCSMEKFYENVNVTSYCKDLVKILEQADQMNEKLTPLKLLEAWMGKGASKLRVIGVVPPKCSRDKMETIIAHLILQQYLREDFSFTAYATISYLKKGPKVDLLKNNEHTIILQMKMFKKNSNKILQEVQDVPSVRWLATMDVALYTSVPQDKALCLLEEIWNGRPRPHRVPTYFLIQLTEVALKKNFFLYKEKIFPKISSMAMGAMFAPSLANLCMQWFENKYVYSSVYMEYVNEWKCYIDNIFLLWRGTKEDLYAFFAYLNGCSQVIRLEMVCDLCSIHFLDSQVQKLANNFVTTLYSKPTDNQQYNSFHLVPLKNSLPFSQLLRCR